MFKLIAKIVKMNNIYSSPRSLEKSNSSLLFYAGERVAAIVKSLKNQNYVKKDYACYLIRGFVAYN